MAKPEIRASQLLTTYGPGAMVDLPDDSVIIAGLEGWRYHKGRPLPIVEEPRLLQKLEAQLGPGLTLRKPPAAVEEKGFIPDIAAYRFPQWVISKRTQKTKAGFVYRRLVHRRDLDNGWLREDDGKRYSVIPVRFVRACPRGHVGDIDWQAFVHGEESKCVGLELFIEERGTTGDLDTVWVRCACGESRAMSAASRPELKALLNCDGRQPWLGPGIRAKCGLPNRLLVRNASNAYFSQTLSVISIPSSGAAIDDIVTGLWESYFKIVTDDATLDVMLRVPGVQQQLDGYNRDEVKAAIDRIRGTSGEDRPVKEVEFEALSKASDELGTDKPGGDFFARNLPRDKWDDPWMAPIERIVLAHRLREVVAQLGFTRFEAVGTDVDGDLEVGVEAAPIASDISWLPAVENRGEGVFIQFSADAIEEWLKRKAVRDRDKQLQGGHTIWHEDHEKSSREYFGLPYYMLHSFSHMLLTAISMECGYPPSSLKERVYARYSQRQYGVLVYTGSPDAEGTLGGLIEAGRRISNHVKRALDSGRLCSNDPVCAFHAPSEHDQLPLLGSACHGCLLVAETSCEQRNDFLDRSLVISTVERLGCEFFK
ncbi:DrmB family protein [Rosistilla oblonga]|uniref:DrmB family protein n=1 Tax=Rosistilla oblonga TaxID=2527990 RepID=UPI003A96C8DF